MPSLKSDFILDFFVCLTLLNGTDFEMIDVFMTTHTHMVVGEGKSVYP